MQADPVPGIKYLFEALGDDGVAVLVGVDLVGHQLAVAEDPLEDVRNEDAAEALAEFLVTVAVAAAEHRDVDAADDHHHRHAGRGKGERQGGSGNAFDARDTKRRLNDLGQGKQHDQEREESQDPGVARDKAVHAAPRPFVRP